MKIHKLTLFSTGQFITHIWRHPMVELALTFSQDLEIGQNLHEWEKTEEKLMNGRSQ